jgi:signal transduction histidine kinase
MDLRDVVHPFLRVRLFTSARFKLVSWYVAVLAFVLIVFSVAVVAVVQRNLFTALNERLVTHGGQLAELVELREGELLFAKLDQINYENDALRTLSVQMYGSDGELIWQAARNQLPVSSELAATLTRSENRFASMILPFERYRVLTIPVERNGEALGALQVGLSLRDIDEAITKLILGLTLTVPGALAAAAVGGWFLAARALKPIEENMQRQRQFVQDASHELRTPLAIIRSNIDVTLANPNPTIPQLKDKLQTINDTTKRMGKIINDLFTLSTSDTQQLKLKPRLVDADKVVRETVRHMRSLAKKKQQTLEVGDCEALVVHVDEDRLKQVLTILVDNAIKYTPEHGAIRVTLIKTPAVDYARLSVQDNGPGISRDSQEKIFERFYRVDKSRSRQLGGNGLGLSIAKTLVERQRGYLSVQSKEGKGTRFDVFLPLVAKKTASNFGLPKFFNFSPARGSAKNQPERSPQVAQSKQIAE